MLLRYVLSKEAFERLGNKLSMNLSFCTETGLEDVDTQACLRKLDVFPEKSLDDLGRERFHALHIKKSFFGDFNDGDRAYASNQLKSGLDCCSDSFISFHYISEKEMIRLGTIVDRHEYLLRLGLEKEKPKFKQIMDEFLMMEEVDNEISKSN